MLSSKEIRQKFLDFFEKKQHKIYDSASLIPDDPTMLLTIAGMVPFKPFFQGKIEPPYPRTASCQKCIRTNDLENVGKTARHQTFFEMLGNFSFGDYFKEEAIIWSWEFVTEELNISKDKLWVSIYEEDEESETIWVKKTGISSDRIVKLGKEQNFWAAGPTGSCGPCSEIYYDFGAEYGCGEDTCQLGCDCDRYLEIWNLVFTELNRLDDGSFEPLPKKNIDTGMGLERVTAVLQGVFSNFDTDLLSPIIQTISSVTGKEYIKDEKTGYSIRVIADHVRAITFLISDGVLPSNDGRGYVLRRILRRAVRHSRLLGHKELFLYKIADKVIEIMEEYYNELEKKREHIKNVIYIEEEKFEKTLDQGIQMAEREIEKLKDSNKNKMDAEISFKLYDTYGFPYELTEEICQEENIIIDFDEFSEKMEEQKNRARNSREVIKENIEDSFIENFIQENGKTNFLGYDYFETQAKVIHINKIKTNLVEVIFDNTVFYAESGGQVSDKGIIYAENFKAQVIEVYKKREIYIHQIEIEKGSLEVGKIYKHIVDIERRNSIRRNHTATHLLHAALKKVVGEHVNQSGSLVNSKELRFDFSHYEPLKIEEIEEIERLVNLEILKNLKVKKEEMDIEKAKEKGAMALFSDKYGKTVRVVTISNFSIELCGGTHVNRTGDIGLLKIVSETGIAAGKRRIEAIAGYNVYNYLRKLENNFTEIIDLLKTDYTNVIPKIHKFQEEIKDQKKEIDRLNQKIANNEMKSFRNNNTKINGVNVLIKSFKDADVKALREAIDNAKNQLNSCIVVLGTNNGKAIFLVGVTQDLIKKGIKAGDIVREIAKIADGNGGGRPDFAQAGGKSGDKVEEALKYAEKLLKEKL